MSCLHEVIGQCGADRMNAKFRLVGSLPWCQPRIAPDPPLTAGAMRPPSGRARSFPHRVTVGTCLEE